MGVGLQEGHCPAPLRSKDQMNLLEVGGLWSYSPSVVPPTREKSFRDDVRECGASEVVGQEFAAPCELLTCPAFDVCARQVPC